MISRCKTLLLSAGHNLRVNDTTETEAGPEEASIVAPIPCSRIDHVRRENVCDDCNDVVEFTSKHDGLDL